MAEDDKNKDTPQTEKSKGGAGGAVKLLGGIVILIALGGGIAMMAIPREDTRPKLYRGPWTLAFFEQEFVANTADDNFSRYIKFAPTCQYFAYEEGYAQQRKQDPTFLPLLEEAFTNVVAGYQLNEIMRDGSNEEMQLASQLELVAEPILFPVHVGDTTLPLETDADSGLRPGDSQDEKGTFRGPFHQHVLHVDAAARTIRLDEGLDVTFAGDETDLQVTDDKGKTVFLDVTALERGFEGEVPIGVQGRIRSLHLGRKLAQ